MRTIVWVLLLLGTCCAASARTIPLLQIDGPIGPVAAEYVTDQLRDAAYDKAPLVVLRLDTPGGLDTSMRRIVRAILTSPVPVVAWVGPSGARAASAGLFVVASASLAAMAPGTNLGAAHPVTLGGGEEGGTMAKKAEEDAAAYIRSLAQQKGRDPTWFERAVVESSSLSAEEALKAGVIDVMAYDLDNLMEVIDGKVVNVLGRDVHLKTKDLVPRVTPMSLRQRVLRTLSDPNVAYLLLLLGFYGLIFELSSPGTIFPGVLGGLCLILAFVGLQTLPFNYAGVLLIMLGLLLLLLEVKITSFGLLTVGGIVCLTLGSLMLIKTSEAYQRLSFTVIVPAVAATVAFFAFAVGKGLSAQRKRHVSGTEALVGQHATALDALGPDTPGKIFVHGEYWNATAESPVAAGEVVEVIGVEGMVLKVGPLDSGRRQP